MIEINLTNLCKEIKVVSIRGTSTRKAHKRKIEVSNKTGKIKLHDGMNDLKLLDLTTDDMKKMLADYGWNSEKATLFGPILAASATAHVKGGKIYGFSTLSPMNERKIILDYLEVNPDMQRQGQGINVMKNIAKSLIGTKYERLILSSLSKNSDAFYNAIGMENISSNKFMGDREWMEQLIIAK